MALSLEVETIQRSDYATIYTITDQRHVVFARVTVGCTGTTVTDVHGNAVKVGNLRYDMAVSAVHRYTTWAAKHGC